MIVEVVASKVGEDASTEVETSYTLLADTMTADLHEGIGTSLVCHLPEKSVQSNGVGSRHLCRNCLSINVIADSTAKSALVSKLTENVVKNGCYGGLAIRTSHSNEVHPLSWVTKIVSSKCSNHILSIGIDEISHFVLNRFRQLFANHNTRSQLDCLADEGMAVNLSASHSYENCTVLDATAINLDACHFLFDTSHNLLWSTILYELYKFHFLHYLIC